MPATVVGHGNELRQSWCSWCKQLGAQKLIGASRWGRAVHECALCAQRTLPCMRTGCRAFARGFLVAGLPWGEIGCLRCQGLIEDWACPEPAHLQVGWCSWCFEETQQALWCSMAAPVRPLFQCTYCSRITARCQGCAEGFSRSHADWCDIQCAACSGVLERWGSLPKVDGKARIRRWCSLCVRYCVHDLEQQRMLHVSIYRCHNCHCLAVPCSACTEATCAKTPELGTFHITSRGLPELAEDGSQQNGGGDVTSKQKCRACVSGKAWTELHRRHREDENARALGCSQRALLRDEHRKLLDRLELVSAFRTCRRDEILIRQGSTEHVLMVIMTGEVSVEKADADTNGRRIKTRTLATLGPGQVIGDLVFLGGGAANATVRCIHNQVSVMILPTADLLDLHLHEQLGAPGTDNREGGNFLVDFYRFLAVHLSERLRIATLTSTSASQQSSSQFAGLVEADASIGTVSKASSYHPACVIKYDAEDPRRKFNINASEYITVQEQCAALVHHGKRPLWGQVDIVLLNATK
jgi:CRP-like cAMP-binding protein